ncbi:MAG TPA: VTT domain-containing protein, partial [Candidatus Sulfotelmatobacter sp.]|nr:VTT domain-containing protein [Candidatus Sulfotelmatobacter sp.]
ETGFVFTPFLPGDSLLFIVGTLAGSGFLNIWLAYVLFLFAAILGNMVNYWLGDKLGHKVFTHKNSRWFNKENLIKTHHFFEKYGGKTIIITRFIPIIRSFAPFVAGMGSMEYKPFLIYNFIGGFLWVTSITFAGYFFGGTKIIKDNFEVAVLGVVFISLLPAIFEYLRHKYGSKSNKTELKSTNLKDIEKSFKKEPVIEKQK